ncbi:MAG: response regulator [Pseudomonadota bacterium]
MRILAAEDNALNQFVLTSMFEGLNVDLVMTANGAEAVEVFVEGAFDVVLMDIEMPVMDGLEAMKEIRRLEARRAEVVRVRMIALTANIDHKRIAACLEAGADAHVAKPIEYDALMAAVGI